VDRAWPANYAMRTAATEPVIGQTKERRRPGRFINILPIRTPHPAAVSYQRSQMPTQIPYPNGPRMIETAGPRHLSDTAVDVQLSADSSFTSHFHQLPTRNLRTVRQSPVARTHRSA